MTREPPHVCPDSGGAHHFRPDINGVPVCSCGEVQLTLDEYLALIEFECEPPLSSEESHRLMKQVAKLLDRSVDELLDADDT